MSGFIFSESTYSTLSTIQPYIPVTPTPHPATRNPSYQDVQSPIPNPNSQIERPATRNPNIILTAPIQGLSVSKKYFVQ